jgi:ribosomal protein S18 acetylase RimI-like enzyme
MRRWLDSLRVAGVAGCHLETFAENTGAVAFFEAMGFEKRRSPSAAPGLRSRSGDRLHVQLMVQSLQVGSSA